MLVVLVVLEDEDDDEDDDDEPSISIISSVSSLESIFPPKSVAVPFMLYTPGYTPLVSQKSILYPASAEVLNGVVYVEVAFL